MVVTAHYHVLLVVAMNSTDFKFTPTDKLKLKFYSNSEYSGKNKSMFTSGNSPTVKRFWGVRRGLGVNAVWLKLYHNYGCAIPSSSRHSCAVETRVVWICKLGVNVRLEGF